jgi:hypothetical protein
MDKSYYENLITSEYRLQPHFMAWVDAGIDALNDMQNTAENIIQAFHIDSAIGVQLDVLGVILGCSRIINFEPSDGSSQTLDDDSYRLLLKAKIVQNQWDGKITSLYTMWADLFPDTELLLIDNQDMSMNVLIIGNFSALEKDFISHGYIIPKPEGVRINFATISTAIFSYGYDNDVMAGYGSPWINSTVL